jgi:hypothetical protein
MATRSTPDRKLGGGTVYVSRGPVVADTDGPGGLVFRTPMVRGDRLFQL